MIVILISEGCAHALHYSSVYFLQMSDLHPPSTYEGFRSSAWKSDTASEVFGFYYWITLSRTQSSQLLSLWRKASHQSWLRPLEKPGEVISWAQQICPNGRMFWVSQRSSRADQRTEFVLLTKKTTASPPSAPPLCSLTDAAAAAMETCSEQTYLNTSHMILLPRMLHAISLWCHDIHLWF